MTNNISHINYAKDASLWDSVLKHDYCSTEKLSIKKYIGATITEYRGIWFDGEYLESSFSHIDHEWYHSEGLINENEVEFCDEEVVYIGMMLSPWGHCITDNLKHLWFLIDKRFQNLSTLTFVYSLMYEGQQIPANFWEMLDLLGIKRTQIREAKGSVRYKNVYLPNHCFFLCKGEPYRHYNHLYVSVIDQICKNIPSSGRDRKVYFSRTRLKYHNRDYGESSIESVFAKKGYEILYPEQMSFVEMVSILKACSSFATTEGSVSHNAIFLREGTELVVVRKVGVHYGYLNSYQFPLNQAKDLNVVWIDSNISFLFYYKKTPWDGPFFMYCSKHLRAWTGYSASFPLIDFFHYMLDYSIKWTECKLGVIKHIILS